ncbi:protein of unknown function [Burkholderia multivorans]
MARRERHLGGGSTSYGRVCSSRWRGRGGLRMPSRCRHYNARHVMLDFCPMSYWRKLFLVLFLALSLPVQSFAAVAMQCAVAHADEDVEFATDAGQPVAEHRHETADAHATTDHGGHRHSPGNTHHAHACSTCVSCCVGAGLPTVPSVTRSLDSAITAVFPTPSTAAASFLTAGIERPPRTLLV